MNNLNTFIRHQFGIGLIMSIWLVAFLIVIGPFDVAELPMAARIQILPTYGVITLVSYMSIVAIQNRVYRSRMKWSYTWEILVITLYNLMVLILSFLYYKTDIVNGTYPFLQFTFEVYYPIFLIILPMLLIARWYLSNRLIPKANKQLVLQGENKQDVLQLLPTELVCVAAADNYVDISYLHNSEMKQKLLRATLKQMHTQMPQLVKVHRSYLINPIHFREWVDNGTIRLAQMTVPVSKNYRQELDKESFRP